MSYQYIYVIKGLTKSINGKEILKKTWLSFLPKAKIGIIGHNGAGKSTFLKILAGLDKDYEGEALIAEGVKVGYLPQEPYLDQEKNVFENIMEGVKEITALINEFNEVSNKFTEIISDHQLNMLLGYQADLQLKIDVCNGWEIEREAEIAMNALRCPPKNANINQISGGEKRRVALCKLLLEKPDMILLDEPTNHLDAESVAWLESYLKEYKGTVLMITHDRYFLDNVVEWILEIDRGDCITWHSNYSTWLKEKHQKIIKEEKEEGNRSKQLKKELEWIQASKKGQQTKSKARIKAYQALLDSKREEVNRTNQIIIPNGPRLGNLVIEVENLSKSFNNKILFSNFSFRVPPGAIVGIIGPNGAGKSTLFNILTGKIQPDSGRVNIGDTVRLGYIDQSRDYLDNNKTVWEEISDGLESLELGNISIKSRAYCSAFNFKGNTQQKKVGELSGGERNRIHLAKLLKFGANVILLDEPSNDLDIETIRALENAILDFTGCIFVISHDRWFLNRIATHLIVYANNGNTLWFEGNYDDYHNYILNSTEVEKQNSKLKYKKLA